MTLRFINTFCLIALSALLVQCRPASDESVEGVASGLDFISFGGISGCGMKYARAPQFNICIDGSQVSPQDVSKAEGYLKRATLTWLRSVKAIDDQVKGNIQFSCNNDTHLKVTLRPGSGTSFAGCGGSGAHSTIYVEKQYGTTLHELGHAFSGLSDTYQGRQAGSCKAGQPESVMCWGAYGPKKDQQGFTLLWPDDVEGIQSNYRNAFSDLIPPSQTIDPLASINPESPWEGVGSTTGQPASQIFAKLDTVSQPETEKYKLYLSTESNIDIVYVCAGQTTETSCLSSQHVVKLSLVRSTGARNIFQVDRPIDLNQINTISVFAGNNTSQRFVKRTSAKIQFAGMEPGSIQ